MQKNDKLKTTFYVHSVSGTSPVSQINTVKGAGLFDSQVLYQVLGLIPIIHNLPDAGLPWARRANPCPARQRPAPGRRHHCRTLRIKAPAEYDIFPPFLQEVRTENAWTTARGRWGAITPAVSPSWKKRLVETLTRPVLRTAWVHRDSRSTAGIGRARYYAKWPKCVPRFRVGKHDLIWHPNRLCGHGNYGLSHVYSVKKYWLSVYRSYTAYTCFDLSRFG